MLLEAAGPGWPLYPQSIYEIIVKIEGQGKYRGYER